MNNKVNILVAEDDQNDRFLLERAFNKAGFKEVVVFACDGKETIGVLQGSGPLRANATQSILLLLDLRMPGMDGFQVLEWLQQHPLFRPARVVVLSSSSDPGDVQRAVTLGADDYKVKPHDMADYVKMIQDVQQQLAMHLATLRRA